MEKNKLEELDTEKEIKLENKDEKITDEIIEEVIEIAKSDKKEEGPLHRASQLHSTSPLHRASQLHSKNIAKCIQIIINCEFLIK